jgi:hypothetical protein
MSVHLRYSDGEVVPRTPTGAKAEEVLDLNDPDSVSSRRAIIDTIALVLEQRHRLGRTRGDIQREIRRGGSGLQRIRLEQALETTTNRIERLNENLRRLTAARNT